MSDRKAAVLSFPVHVSMVISPTWKSAFLVCVDDPRRRSQDPPWTLEAGVCGESENPSRRALPPPSLPLHSRQPAPNQSDCVGVRSILGTN